MERTVTGAQYVSRMCFGCGVENAAGLNARFLELDNDELLAVFEPREQHQGYPGRLHGGLAATLLDETIGRAISLREPGVWGVTLELTVRYRKPVPLDRGINAIARITSDTDRGFTGSGEIILEDGSVAVEATGRYLRLPIERIVDEDFAEQWFADTRDLPPTVDI